MKLPAIDQAIPIPKKTLTALLPVTFPIDASAYSSCMAATLLANVSSRRNNAHFKTLQKPLIWKIHAACDL